jgi:hypothetical protein
LDDIAVLIAEGKFKLELYINSMIDSLKATKQRIVEQWDHDLEMAEKASARIDEIFQENFPAKEEQTFLNPELIREKLKSSLDWENLKFESVKLQEELALKLEEVTNSDHLPFKYIRQLKKAYTPFD